MALTATETAGVNDAALRVTGSGASPELISGEHLVAKAPNGIDDEGIEVVDVRREQVTAHAADGHARMTGQPGCAVVTAGPGTSPASMNGAGRGDTLPPGVPH